MHISGPALLATALLSATAPRALADEATVTVVTPSLGAVVGRRDAAVAGVDAFRGLRYGAPPLGPARFAPAAPHVAPGPTDASRFGAWCFQATFPEEPDPEYVACRGKREREERQRSE